CSRFGDAADQRLFCERIYLPRRPGQLRQGQGRDLAAGRSLQVQQGLGSAHPEALAQGLGCEAEATGPDAAVEPLKNPFPKMPRDFHLTTKLSLRHGGWLTGDFPEGEWINA